MDSVNPPPIACHTTIPHMAAAAKQANPIHRYRNARTNAGVRIDPTSRQPVSSPMSRPLNACLPALLTFRRFADAVIELAVAWPKTIRSQVEPPANERRDSLSLITAMAASGDKSP